MLRAALLCALAAPACTSPDFKVARDMVYLDQGARWTPRERALFYYTPQGTRLHGMRYAWFQHLEGADGPISAPSHLARFGFIYAPEQFDPNFDGGDLNPGNFPVGFAQHRDEETGEAMLDISCAACHTGQLEYKGVTMRVDGGQPMHGFAWTEPGQLVPEILTALQSTFVNPLKFDRFAERVLGTRYPDAKPELREQLEATIAGFTNEGITTFDLYFDNGYGRLDALGRIADTLFGQDIDMRNARETNAPVSYPQLWDIWKFDWVQWNGSVAQPLGRNVGEALGVKAELELVDRKGNALPPDEMFGSSVLLREQDCLETTLWQLGPPRWPEAILGPIDRALAKTGSELFSNHCQGCHGPNVYPEQPKQPYAEPVRYDCEVHDNDRKPTPDKPVEWKMCIVPAWDIGTDPTVVNNYLDATYDGSALDPGNTMLRDISPAEGLERVIDKVTAKKFAELKLSAREQWEMQGWGRKNEMRDMRGYKSRPLHGVWATPPFLHNGSVRTIYQLLSPQPEREAKMWIGSREYDPVNLGYENEELDWAYELDTSLEGNHNTGHQFTNAGGAGVIGPELTHAERMALIEYLKVLGSPEDPDDRDYAQYAEPWAGPARCATDLQGPSSNPELRWPM
jgi:mono/diheme cytochrome c family protein